MPVGVRLVVVPCAFGAAGAALAFFAAAAALAVAPGCGPRLPMIDGQSTKSSAASRASTVKGLSAAPYQI